MRNLNIQTLALSTSEGCAKGAGKKPLHMGIGPRIEHGGVALVRTYTLQVLSDLRSEKCVKTVTASSLRMAFPRMVKCDGVVGVSRGASTLERFAYKSHAVAPHRLVRTGL